jgi:hypothetical protein
MREAFIARNVKTPVAATDQDNTKLAETILGSLIFRPSQLDMEKRDLRTVAIDGVTLPGGLERRLSVGRLSTVFPANAVRPPSVFRLCAQPRRARRLALAATCRSKSETPDAVARCGR